MTLISYLREKAMSCALAGGLTLASIAGGCGESRNSEVLHGDATVVSRVYTPEHNGIKVGLDSGYNPSPGISLGGGLKARRRRTPESFLLVFKCDGRLLAIEGSSPRHKELYEKLMEGQEVELAYRNPTGIVWNAPDMDTDGDGQKEKVIYSNILDATPKKK